MTGMATSGMSVDRGDPLAAAAARCPVAHGGAAATDRPAHAHRTGTGTTETLAEAREFLEGFHRENNRSHMLDSRWACVAEEIRRTGGYEHTLAELTWGARVAWRNSVRCVGRVRWRSLAVRDARQVTTTDEMYRELVAHLRYATNGGRIRSTITLVPADTPAGPRARVWNEQLVRFAGHRDPNGRITGDPRYAGFTDLVRRMGWRPPHGTGRFDVLPWLLESATEAPTLYDPPTEHILMVPISHPELAWFADLGLRWHAVPVISNMRLRVGGVDYSCAPFNGWYVGDEIASRNLADQSRYDMLPAIARRMGLDTSSNSTFWRQRAVVELNVAVHHSFRAAGVMMSDALTESDLFAEFGKREEGAGRACHADWSWVNGHLGHSMGAAFHRYYDPAEPNPNFWLDPAARSLAGGEVGTPLLRQLHGSPAGLAEAA
jgi:nitric-oxide synthase